ncbi:hypothetical protein HYFRA_00006875 [Hymenoscyphus fraxineus]|uniref:C2H2-type domain-containing protein n=1 Tax=Hymenoscyphus fraxineus TaxID=746836 RepID=A0A9N9KRS2_9HELO|nr:hypothetical protein HYFRA_00006875 [Hymenoscyphus fraxineus]
MDSSAYQQGPVMGQSPFFYYNPDPKPDNRQHGHFSQQPSNVQVPVYHPHVHPMPSTPIYSRPNSSCSQPPMHPQMFNSGFAGTLTPMASPRPMYQKPTILIQEHAPRMRMETEMHDADMYFYPSTPPLSASNSTSSSPSSYEAIPLPMNNIFLGLGGFEGVKEGCEGEVQSDTLAGGEWSRCGSPPLTPVFIHPNSLTSNGQGHASELLSATSCPSLSPSPSPYPRSVISEQDFDFCDPRNLTVASGASASPAASNLTSTAAEFPALPTLCAGDDEEHRFMLAGETFNKAAHAHAKNFTFTAPHHGLPSFDQFSDLDSEEDFVNGLVNFPTTDNVQFYGNKRQRTTTSTGSDLLSLDPEPFVSEDELEDFEHFDDAEQFAVACLPSPPASGSETEVKKEKRTKKPKKARRNEEDDSTEFDNLVRSRKYTVPMNSASGESVQEGTSEGHQHHSVANSQSGSSEHHASHSVMGSDSGTPHAAPVNRRGRKQSLTEDPSKTFVCDKCNRRFRRQEHLKRHYRSLHTEDKPFECHECGKKFSRSDNLTQHARTHGSGAIVMGVLEDGELAPDHPNSNSEDEHIQNLGSVLFNVAQAASGSETDDSASDSQSRKKRKRSE